MGVVAPDGGETLTTRGGLAPDLDTRFLVEKDQRNSLAATPRSSTKPDLARPEAVGFISGLRPKAIHCSLCWSRLTTSFCSPAVNCTGTVNSVRSADTRISPLSWNPPASHS